MIYYIYNKTKAKELFIMMDIKYIEKMTRKEREMENLGIELDSLSPKEMISILEDIKVIHEIDKIQKMYFIRIENKPYTIIIDNYNTVYTRHGNTYIPLEYIPDGYKVFNVLAEIL